MKKSCKFCQWASEEYERVLDRVRECRKDAPTTDGFPIVLSNSWCGDFRWNDELIEKVMEEK